jgi:uncharacterized protein (TIGR00251 family)
MSSYWSWQHDTLILRCQVQPKAQRDAIVGEHDGRLRIRINALPADGAANQRLVAFLAATFKVAKSQVRIQTGHSARLKTAAISAPVELPVGLGISAPEVSL